MPKLDNWAGVGAINESDRAHRAWERIQQRPTSIKLKRGNTILTEQTVRVEHDSMSSDIRGEAGGDSGKQRTVVFGVKGHCDVANTDIKRDDIFVIGDNRYRVMFVLNQIGEVQAMCEAMA